MSTKAEEQLATIREVVASYEANDVFNCDETGLLWKKVPDRSLITRRIPGRKKDKSRITAHFCANSDRTEKLPIWFIGMAKTPKAFTAAGVRVENMNIKWRHSKNVWMTTPIMTEWLPWFDSRMTAYHRPEGRPSDG